MNIIKPFTTPQRKLLAKSLYIQIVSSVIPNAFYLYQLRKVFVSIKTSIKLSTPLHQMHEKELQLQEVAMLELCGLLKISLETVDSGLPGRLGDSLGNTNVIRRHGSGKGISHFVIVIRESLWPAVYEDASRRVAGKVLVIAPTN